jgi:rhodanese-related sulfurtransferase
MVSREIKKVLLWVLAAAVVIGIMLAGEYYGNHFNKAPEGNTIIAKNISPQEAFALIGQAGSAPDIVILDVRTTAEFASGHLENAINIDFYSSTFTVELERLDRNKTYLIYCRLGNRGGKTLDIMAGLGFPRVYNISGGIDAWQAAGLPVVK